MFFFKHKTAYEMRIRDGVQTCALPIYGSQRRFCIGSCTQAIATLKLGADRHGDIVRDSGHADIPCVVIVGQESRPAKSVGGVPNGPEIEEIVRASCRESVCHYV